MWLVLWSLLSVICVICATLAIASKTKHVFIVQGILAIVFSGLFTLDLRGQLGLSPGERYVLVALVLSIGSWNVRSLSARK